MTTIKQDFAAAEGTLTVSTLNSLATLPSAQYAISDAINHTTNKEVDCDVYGTLTVGSTSGNKQILVYVLRSYDGTVFDNGPTTATDTARDAMMIPLGVIQVPNASEVVHFAFNIRAAMRNGMLPHSSKLVFKNDSGVALSAATVKYRGRVGLITI